MFSVLMMQWCEKNICYGIKVRGFHTLTLVSPTVCSYCVYTTTKITKSHIHSLWFLPICSRKYNGIECSTSCTIVISGWLHFKLNFDLITKWTNRWCLQFHCSLFWFFTYKKLIIIRCCCYMYGTCFMFFKCSFIIKCKFPLVKTI